MSGSDFDLDALLKQTLAPDARPADAAFVQRVDRAVSEAERYRRVRARLLADLLSEGLTMAAIAGCLVVLSRSPSLMEALPALIWPLLLALFLVWMVLSRGPSLRLA